MRILLIQPPRWNPAISVAIDEQEPLGLETIAGMVPEQEIKLLDMRFDEDKLREELETFKPGIVGITGVACEYYKVCKVLQEVKNYSRDILTVVGGAHATLLPTDYQGDFVDVIVIGEGELTFKELVETYEKRGDLSKLAGLALNREGKLIFTKERELIEDLNSIPLPNRTLTKKYRQFYARGRWRPLGSIYSTKGCPFRCTFCCTWIMGGEKFRTRGVDVFMKDLASIDEYYIFVCDDNTIHDTSYSEQLYHAVKESGIKKEYQFYGRADTIVRHSDLIEKWQTVGLKRLLVGIEHISNERLRNVNKATTANINKQALTILKSLDIETIAYFLINPDFEKRDFDELADYCEKMEITHPIFVCLNAYPGTQLYEDMRGQIHDPNYELIDVLHCPYKTKLPIKTFYRYYVDLYRRVYLRKIGKKTGGYAYGQLEKIFEIFEKDFGI